MTFFKKIIAACRILTFVVWTAALTTLLLLAHIFMTSKKGWVLRTFHGGVCKIFQITVETHGAMSSKAKTIFVANHASYMDIPILGSVLDGQFVAKSEVGKWPIIGHLARLQNTIYIERRPSQAKKQVAQLGQAIEHGGNLIIFPEGTNTLGDEVKRFKASLFGNELMAQEPWIQPVAVAYSMPDGTSISATDRPIYGWPLEAGFGGHFWAMIQHGGMRADIIFHDPFPCKTGTDRKEVLAASQALVEKSVLKAI